MSKSTRHVYLDNTILQSFCDCPRKFYWAHVRHLRPKGGVSPPLEFGKQIHAALEAYYLTGSEEACIEAFKKDYNEACMDAKRNIECGVAILNNYFKKWSPEHWVVKRVESALIVQLSSDITFCGRADLIVEQMGLSYIGEHKTTSAMHWVIPKPNHQASGYTYCARVLGHPVSGVIFNLIGVFAKSSKKPLHERFHRVITTRTDEELDEWRHWVLDTKVQMDKCLDSGYFPQHTNGCRMCSYKSLCTASERVLESVAEFEYEVSRWAPWESES